MYRRMAAVQVPRGPLGRRGTLPLERAYVVTDEPVSLEGYERLAIRRALDECAGDKAQAARLLRVGKSTLYRRMAELGLE